jgi:hypothetical protein
LAKERRVKMVQYAREPEIKLTGNQSDQLKQVTAILNRFRHRLQRKVVAVIPPIPLFMYCGSPENQLVGKLMLPLSGTIPTVYINVGQLPREGVVVSVIIRAAEAVISHDTVCTKPVTQLRLETRATVGTVIEVRSTGGGDIAVGLLLLPDRTALQTEQYLLDAILALEEPENATDEV